MKKIVPFLLALAALSWPALAAGGEARVTATDLRQMLPDKVIALELGEVASDSGQLLLLGRDSRTRQMEWFLLDLDPLAVRNQGKAPFAGFDGFAVSPTGRQAVVRSRYPSGLWALDTGAGTWTPIFTDTKGLRFTSDSPLLYTGSRHAETLVDRVDEEEFVQDSLLVRFVPVPFAIEAKVSLPKLRDEASALVAEEDRAGRTWWPDFVRFGQDGSFAFVLQSRTKADVAEAPVDYLFLRRADGTLSLLDQAPAVLPLDYDAPSGRVLYRKTEAPDLRVLMLAEGGRKTEVTRIPMLVGAMLPGNRIGTLSVESGKIELFVGPVGQELKKVRTVPGSYSVAFLDDGERVLLLGERDLRLVPLAEQ